MGPLLGHESVLDNSVDGSNAVVATAIAQPITTAIVIPLEPLIGFAVLIRWSILTLSASPTAAPAADRPTSLSAPLALRSRTLPAPYLQAHTSDTIQHHPPLTSA